MWAWLDLSRWTPPSPNVSWDWLQHGWMDMKQNESVSYKEWHRAVSFRCWVLCSVLLCSGWSGETSEPQSRLQVHIHNTSQTVHDMSKRAHGTEMCSLPWLVVRFVPRHADELGLEADDPVLILNQSEDLWCQGYNMRTGASGIFPAFYAVRVAKDISQGTRQRARPWTQNVPFIDTSWLMNVSLFCFLLTVQNDGWTEQFLVRFLGSVHVPIHKGNDVLCAAIHKVHVTRSCRTETNHKVSGRSVFFKQYFVGFYIYYIYK